MRNRKVQDWLAAFIRHGGFYVKVHYSNIDSKHEIEPKYVLNKPKQLNATPNNEINPKQELCSQQCNDLYECLRWWINENSKKSFTKSLSSPSSNNATDNLATSSSTTALLTYIKQKNGSELNQPTT